MPLPTSTREVFADKVFAQYGQAYVQAANADFSAAHSKGQANGLCGAAIPGQLFLVFGTHTGHVHLSIRICSDEPTLSEEWEEVVEVPFSPPTGTEVGFVDWNREVWAPVPLLPGTYRARYSAKNFRLAELGDQDFDPSGECVERYELVFWPAPIRADAILKVTSLHAKYWHEVAQGKAT